MELLRQVTFPSILCHIHHHLLKDYTLEPLCSCLRALGEFKMYNLIRITLNLTWYHMLENISYFNF